MNPHTDSPIVCRTDSLISALESAPPVVAPSPSRTWWFKGSPLLMSTGAFPVESARLVICCVSYLHCERRPGQLPTGWPGICFRDAALGASRAAVE